MQARFEAAKERSLNVKKNQDDVKNLKKKRLLTKDGQEFNQIMPLTRMQELKTYNII